MCRGVVERYHFREGCKVTGCFQALTEAQDLIDTAFLVTAVMGKDFPWCYAFSKVMAKRTKSDQEATRQFAGAIKYKHDVHAGIDLRMVLRRLRDAEKRLNLGVDHLKSTERPQRQKIA